ncbi:hypothetical protein ACO9S2_14905 [Nitrospira sp. NS4]|uniref:hypothetical protein n=1 Tax=Nitrospira sp. NS4 TaxID=3414498 RepID=UPI003C2C9027
MTLETVTKISGLELYRSSPSDGKAPAIAAASVPVTLAAVLLLWIGWSRFGLATNDPALFSFSFLTLLYFAAFSILSARERRRFWATMPSKTLVAALAVYVLAGTALTLVGLPSLIPLPWWKTLVVFVYAMISCLVVNDAVKVAMITWRVPAAMA